MTGYMDRSTKIDSCLKIYVFFFLTNLTHNFTQVSTTNLWLCIDEAVPSTVVLVLSMYWFTFTPFLFMPGLKNTEPGKGHGGGKKEVRSLITYARSSKSAWPNPNVPPKA